MIKDRFYNICDGDIDKFAYHLFEKHKEKPEWVGSLEGYDQIGLRISKYGRIACSI